jgi:hypothetical protein
MMLLSNYGYRENNANDLFPDLLFLDTNVTDALYEPRHDKTNIMRLRPAWIQTSLRIRAV